MYLSWRIRMKGYRIKIAPDSKLKHFGSVTTDANFAGKTSFFGEKNRIMNIFLLYETKTIIKLIPLFVFTTVLHNLYHIKGIPYRIKSYFWLLTKISYIYKQRKKIQKERTVLDPEIVKYMSCRIFDDCKLKTFMKTIIMALNKAAYIYCMILKIKTIEFYDKKVKP